VKRGILFDLMLTVKQVYAVSILSTLAVVSGCDQMREQRSQTPEHLNTCLDRATTLDLELKTARYEKELLQERYDKVAAMRVIGADLYRHHLEDEKRLVDLKVRIFALESELKEISKSAPAK